MIALLYLLSLIGSTSAQTAADLNGWGTPIASASDEFNYGSPASPASPDSTKWWPSSGPDNCMSGHNNFGRRCAKNSIVVGGVLQQLGDSNGDTGWLGSKYGQTYGRWEVRSRSYPLETSNAERPYHPVLILWPDSDRWPEDGEYDYLENEKPGDECAMSNLHYPQVAERLGREGVWPRKCTPGNGTPGDSLANWHNVAIEWMPGYIASWIDGVLWYNVSGEANEYRRCLSCASSMHQTIQLDNFHGAGMQRAMFEIDWVRVYEIPGVSVRV